MWEVVEFIRVVEETDKRVLLEITPGVAYWFPKNTNVMVFHKNEKLIYMSDRLLKRMNYSYRGDRVGDRTVNKVWAFDNPVKV